MFAAQFHKQGARLLCSAAAPAGAQQHSPSAPLLEENARECLVKTDHAPTNNKKALSQFFFSFFFNQVGKK